MQRTESEGYSSPKSSTSLLAKNLQEMDQSVKEMLKLIQEDGDSFSNKSDVYQHKRPELIAHIEQFSAMYRSLAERYDQLTGDLPKDVLSDRFRILGSEISDQGSPQFFTPAPLQKSSHQAVGVNLSPSSGGGSSEPSLKEGSESFSSSSSDSESDSFNSSINNYLGSSVNTDGKEQKVLDLAAELPSMKNRIEELEEDNADSMLVEAKHGSYDLLAIVRQYEEELRVTKLKLQLSEEEVGRLKSELEKNESMVLCETNMRAQLEEAQRTIKVREADLEIEKRHGLQMQEQIAQLETQVLDSNFKMGQLMEEIAKLNQEAESKVSEGTQQLQCQLDLARENIATLEAKLDSEKMWVLELQENIVKYQADVSDRDREVRELEAALCDVHEKFSIEKAQLHAEIFSLLEEQKLLDTKLNDSELLSKSLEDKVRQCEVEKLELKVLTDGVEFGLRDEISGLKVELDERGQQVECLNKTFDGLKLKYDMLMAEKDQANAKINTLIAEVSAQDNQIRQMEEHISQLRMENVDVVAGSENARKLADELRLKVEELEREVERQKIDIANGAEEKREAIRQLCFSLEHFRSGYQELRQAFVGHKRRAVMAS